MKTHKSCLICQSKNISGLRKYERHFLNYCLNCGFVFSERIPTHRELEEHYKGYSRDDYLSPLTIKRYNELLDYFEPYRKTNNLLDIGCGMGYFLEEAKKRGWDVFGTEFTDAAIKICKQKDISMKKGVFNPKNYKIKAFDIITSFEVIEHINNPLFEVANYYEVLRKNGMLYITTPNFNSLLRYRMQENYNVITYPEHLSYYTPKTINNLLILTGFKKSFSKSTGFSITRLRTSQGKSNQKYISKFSDDEKIRNKIENNVLLKIFKITLNYSLSFFGVGDSLKVSYIKK